MTREELLAANDNENKVIEGTGNVFLDLGFERDDAERALLALAEFHAKGGVSFEDFERELRALPPSNEAAR